MKWTRAVKRDLAEGVAYTFDPDAITTALYRPFSKRSLYFSAKLNEMQYLMPRYFGERGQLGVPSIIVTDPTAQKPWMTLATSICPDLHCVGAASGAVVLPLSLNDGALENITDWALNRFHEQYEKGRGRRKRPITKEAIFHYVYAVFHDPIYRKAYALDLKQDLPRIPLHADFWQWADWGKEVIAMHIDFETVAPFGLQRVDRSDDKARRAGTPPKAVLKGNRAAGTIAIDSETTLSGVPDRAWDYQLAGKCAIDWVLDQHKEKKPKDTSVLAAFGTPKLADRKQQLIELLGRVVAISARTMAIVDAMETLERDAEVSKTDI